MKSKTEINSCAQDLYHKIVDKKLPIKIYPRWGSCSSKSELISFLYLAIHNKMIFKRIGFLYRVRDSVEKELKIDFSFEKHGVTK